MLSNLATFLPILSLVLSVCLAIGGLIAFRQGYAKQAGEIEERVIGALKVLNTTQETQLVTCEKEIMRLKRVVATIQYALKRRGLRIEIDGDSITLIDEQSRQSRTVQIRMADKFEGEDTNHKGDTA